MTYISNLPNKIPLLLSVFILLLFFFSCQKDAVYTGSDLDISFSSDTLRFDTVFTSIGSATRIIKVYNHQNRAISIREIRLSDEGKIFRMNVDGIPTTQASNVEIQGRDSIYIFVEVTVDPDQPSSFSPFIIEEAIIVNTGAEEKRIVLEAWGQNANYFPSRDAKGKINLLSCNLNRIIWNDPRPYVLYGILAIDSCELVIPAGSRIYVHGGVVRDGQTVYNDGSLIMLKNGTLKVEGTVDKPVIIQGDRLETEFSLLAGQWAGIRFFAGSRGHVIQHAEIKNAITGIRADSLSSVRIENSMIHHTAGSGVVGIQADIDVYNSLFYNNGGPGVQFVYGGHYSLTYCTFANYNNQSDAVLLTNYLCSDPLCQEAVFVSPLKATITNCIIDGNADKEFFADDISRGQDVSIFQVDMMNNVIKHNDAENNIVLSSCKNCIFTSTADMLFISRSEHDYTLAEGAKALDVATPLTNIPFDIRGRSRDPLTPDAGCYEFEK